MKSEIEIQRGDLTEREFSFYEALSDFQDTVTLIGSEAGRDVLRRVLDLYTEFIGPVFVVGPATNLRA